MKTDRTGLAALMLYLQGDLVQVATEIDQLKEAACTLNLNGLADRLQTILSQFAQCQLQATLLRKDLLAFVGNPNFNGPTIFEKLKELRRLSALESASFGFATETVSSNPHMAEPIIGMPIDDFIKNRTALYRESWILPLIDELIEIVRDGTPCH